MPIDTERERAREELADERERLREQLFDWLDPVMIALGLLTLVLILVEFAASLSPRQLGWINNAQQAIWIIFAIEFAVQFTLAPRKLHFLRTHWLAAVSVALPTLRVFRAMRATRALRSLRLVRLVGGTNRAMRALQEMLRGRQFGYLIALTLLVVAVGTVGGYFFERDHPEATLRTLPDALWWAACLITTINNEKYAVSPEGRVLAVLLRLYAAAVFGLVTANIASYFVGQQRAASRVEQPDDTAQSLAEELRLLRAELASLRHAVDAAKRETSPRGDTATGARADEMEHRPPV